MFAADTVNRGFELCFEQQVIPDQAIDRLGSVFTKPTIDPWKTEVQVPGADLINVTGRSRYLCDGNRPLNVFINLRDHLGKPGSVRCTAQANVSFCTKLFFHVPLYLKKEKS